MVRVGKHYQGSSKRRVPQPPSFDLTSRSEMSPYTSGVKEAFANGLRSCFLYPDFKDLCCATSRTTIGAASHCNRGNQGEASTVRIMTWAVESLVCTVDHGHVSRL